MGNDPNWHSGPGGIFSGPQEAAPVLPDHQAICHACTGMAPLPPGPLHVESCPLHVPEAQMPQPQAQTPGYRDPAGKAPDQHNARRAARRLSNTKPSDFEKVIDLFYEWRFHEPHVEITEIMRRVLAANHNIRDVQAIQAMEGLIRETRMKRITQAITKLGIDAAEDLLGLSKDAEAPESGDDF